MKCEKCGHKATALYPVDGKHLCVGCLPASVFLQYPGWTLAGGEEPRRKKLLKEPRA